MARKLLLVVLVLLVGGVLGAPYLYGVKAEQIHREQSQRLKGRGASAIKESDFSRGWFKSSARDLVEVCSLKYGCKELVISTVLHHGPIAVTGLLDGVAPMRPVSAVAVSTIKLSGLSGEDSVKPALPNITVTNIVETGGNWAATLNMPASTHTGKNATGEMKLSQGGLQGHMQGMSGSDQEQVELSFPSLKMESNDGSSVALNGISAKFDGAGGDSGYVGKFEQKISDISVLAAPQDPQPMMLKDLTLSFEGKRSADGLTQSQLKLDIVSMTNQGRQYGPAKLDGELMRFNRAALTRMQQELAAIKAQQKPPQEEALAAMAIYQKNLPEVLKSRPELNLRSLSVKTPEGDLISSLKLVAVPPQGTLDMGTWLTMLQAELSLQIPAVMLWNILDGQMQAEAQATAAKTGQAAVIPSQEAIGAKVTELVKANVFMPKLDANAYTLQLAFLEGRLLVNGQENQDLNSLTKVLAAAKGSPAAVQEPAPAP